MKGLWSLLLTLVFLVSMPFVVFGEGNDGYPINNDEITEDYYKNLELGENANNTGADPIRKQPRPHHGNSIHKDYNYNTNSCASCHQTHTAQGESLLFADEIAKTCLACHDGTAGGPSRNVLRDISANGHISSAGTFGGTEEGNMSIHAVNSALTVSAAPGGNLENGGTWGGERFSCASCHSAHGSYSDSYLAYNPNNMGRVSVEDGGKAVFDAPVRDFTAATGSGYEALRGTPEEHGFDNADYEDGALMIMLYKDDNPDTTPWLYGYQFGRPKNYWSKFENTSGARVVDYETGGTKMNFSGAYVVSTDADGKAALESASVAQLARGYKVRWKDDEKDGIQLWDSAGQGVAYSEFCASCHTDYLAASRDGKTGSEGNPSYYRHTTNNNTYTCVRCHYAHGTDVTVMIEARGYTIWDLSGPGGDFEGDLDGAKDFMLDVNDSSALKKFTNMTSCWACHNSSKAGDLKNVDPEYRSNGTPKGMPSGR